MTDSTPGRRDGATRDRRDFRFEYHPPVCRFGRGCVEDLGDELAGHGVERALVVAGETVGSTPAVADPVRDGLGERFAGVFAATTPAKRLATAFDVVDAMRDRDADALVALGGGSTLDVATVARALAVDDRPQNAIYDEFADRGTFALAEGDLPALAVVPTTLAGAELSQVAGITAGPENDLLDATEAVGGGVSDPRLMPTAVFHDAELVATTPRGVLAASAMNGFDKALESVYARNGTPMTDATAARALSVLKASLPALGEEPLTPAAVDPILEGILLAQYGVSRPDGTTLSLVHAFGHALTRTSDLQQGAAHAVVAPHALRFVLESVDANRDLLADAFNVDSSDRIEQIAGIVDAVADVRDAMGLPTNLSDVDGPVPESYDAVAQAVLDDSFMANAPRGLDATHEDVVAILEAAT